MFNIKWLTKGFGKDLTCEANSAHAEIDAKLKNAIAETEEGIKEKLRNELEVARKRVITASVKATLMEKYKIDTNSSAYCMSGVMYAEEYNLVEAIIEDIIEQTGLDKNI